MRPIMIILLAACLAVPAAAGDLDNVRPAKNATPAAPPPPDPEVVRQGGDTILDAVEIDVFHQGSGTTVGYTDDYDEVCPYDNSTSPDVVYTILNEYDTTVDIDMAGSTYDTKIYVYDEELNLVACNDDYYPDYVSKLEGVTLAGGVRHYLVIDGYGGDAGYYELTVVIPIYDVVECPDTGVWEGEPELYDGYVDEYNGGCNSIDHIGEAPFQHLDTSVFCGHGGWYIFDGSNYRDTDWFTVGLPASGSLHIEGQAECQSYLFELGPQDCDQVGVLQDVIIDNTGIDGITVTGEPFTEVWIWVGSATFEPPPGWIGNEYLYVLWLDGVIAMEEHSWTGVKALFD